ncbi:MAG: hypothetical protein ACI9N0_001687 [Ilumatobacter sp.]|jgi:hypothetical protein
MFHHGDRVRYATTGPDGFPVVRYGFVGGTAAAGGPVVVMLDGELGGDVVNIDTLQPVHISNVTLTLEGTDLLEDPALRQGLVHLWAAEAESAGLEIGAMHPMGTGVSDSCQGFALAELMSAGEPYVLKASLCPSDLDAVLVYAARPDGHRL